MSDNINITAYLKTTCGWSNGVRAALAKHNLPYEEKDIIKNPAFRFEMEQKSGQPLSPCVEVNGTMLADISGEELEAWLLENKLVEPKSEASDVPMNAPCSDEQHAAMASNPVNLKL
ncbi:MAG: glutaredoxin family protein [Chthoniobacterales bacterium]